MIKGSLQDEPQEGRRSVGKLLQHSRYDVIRVGKEVVAIWIKEEDTECRTVILFPWGIEFVLISEAIKSVMFLLRLQKIYNLFCPWFTYETNSVSDLKNINQMIGNDYHLKSNMLPFSTFHSPQSARAWAHYAHSLFNFPPSVCDWWSISVWRQRNYSTEILSIQGGTKAIFPLNQFSLARDRLGWL